MPLLDQVIPSRIHRCRHCSYVNPRSSSETPNWNPHEGQISYDPPPLSLRGCSVNFEYLHTGHVYVTSPPLSDFVE